MAMFRLIRFSLDGGPREASEAVEGPRILDRRCWINATAGVFFPRAERGAEERAACFGPSGASCGSTTGGVEGGGTGPRQGAIDSGLEGANLGK